MAYFNLLDLQVKHPVRTLVPHVLLCLSGSRLMLPAPTVKSGQTAKGALSHSHEDISSPTNPGGYIAAYMLDGAEMLVSGSVLANTAFSDGSSGSPSVDHLDLASPSAL